MRPIFAYGDLVHNDIKDQAYPIGWKYAKRSIRIEEQHVPGVLFMQDEGDQKTGNDVKGFNGNSSQQCSPNNQPDYPFVLENIRVSGSDS